MAKAAARKRTVTKRKPASSRGGSRLALTGWVVAVGFGIAWAVPHARPWLDGAKLPWAKPEHVAASAKTPDASTRQRNPEKLEKRQPESRRVAAVTPLVSVTPPSKSQPSNDRKIAPRSASKVEERVTKPVPKPVQNRQASRPVSMPDSPIPPTSVPNVSKTAARAPIVVPASIRTAAAPVSAPVGKPGELAIRKYPFTTAATIAYVGDLRTVRIVGGQGDWKKVEVVATGATGWLRLQRLEADRGIALDMRALTAANERTPAKAPPAPVTPPASETGATGSR